MGFLKPLSELGLGSVSKDTARLVDAGEQPVLFVPVPPLFVENPGLVPGQLIDPVCEIDDPDLPPGAKIDRLTDRLLVGGHLHETVDQIPDIGEVPGLLARAGDRQGQAVHRPVEEVRDDVAVLAGDLPRAVGVEEPGVDDRKTVKVVEVVGVELTDHLGDLVGGVEFDGDIMLLKRHLRVQAVDAAAGRGIDEPVDVNEVSILQDLEDAHAVDHQIFFRVVDRVLVGEVGGKVVDDVGFRLKRPL